MSAGKPEPLAIHGWTIFAHPLFLTQIEALARQVEILKQNDPAGYVNKNASKRLAAITKLAFDAIPQDPTRPEYRQGGTLGDDHKHWFRAKFFQQYRLFFRYHAPSKVIVYAWVNDEDTKRAYESSYDAYRVFHKMLESGHPPDEWDQLLAEAQNESRRMQESLARVTAQEIGCFKFAHSVPQSNLSNNRSLAWLNHLIDNSKSTSSKAHKTRRV